jgi:hypothetical protein
MGHAPILKLLRRDDLLISVTDREPPVQVGILLDDQKAIFKPQYSFTGDAKPDEYTFARTMEICEAFAYISGLAVAIKAKGKIDIVKYDPSSSQYIK